MQLNEQKIYDLAKILRNHCGIRDFTLDVNKIKHDEYSIVYDDFAKVYQVDINGILLRFKSVSSVIDLIETSIN